MRHRRALVPAAVLAALAAAPSFGAPSQSALTVAADPATGTVTLTDTTPAPDHLLIRPATGGLGIAQFGLTADQGGCHFDASIKNATLVKRDGALVCPGTRVEADLGDGADILDLAGTAIPAHALLGAGADKARLGSAADVVDGGPGRDKLDTGAGDDQVAVHDGAADRVFCGPGTDTITDLPDPGDDLRNDCERTAYAWGTSLPLPRVVTVGAGGAIAIPVGHADQAVSLAATLASAPPRKSHDKAFKIASGTTAAPAGSTATVKLTIAGLTHGAISKRKVLRVVLTVVATAADGTRTPVRLPASEAKAAKGDPDVLDTGQLVLRIPDALRHPKKP
jgi:hypothetical protein